MLQTYSESRGHNFTLNATFNDVEADNYDGLIIPGGRAPEYLAIDASIVDLVKNLQTPQRQLQLFAMGNWS